MIEKILHKHFWDNTNFKAELEDALKEIETLLYDQCFFDCDSLCKLIGLPKKYKVDKVRKIVYE